MKMDLSLTPLKQWASTTLEGCVDILDGKRVPINSEERNKRISGKKRGELFPYYGATGQVGWIDDFLFNEELVLLGEDGAPFLETTKNKAYLVKGKFWVNNHAHVIRAKEGITTNKFICHYLNFFDFHGYVTGTTRLKLNQGQMRRFPVFLPPIPEQERIVARIEELFTQLDAGTAALKRAQAGLKRYKACLYQNAFEGKLVNQNPSEEHSEKIIRKIGAEPYISAYLPALPDGWCWIKLGDISELVTSGSRGWAKYYSDSGDLFLRVGNFSRLSNEIKLDDIVFVNPPSDSEGMRTRISVNDILITITADVGKVGIFDERIFQNFPLAFVNQHVSLIRLKNPKLSEYISIALVSESLQKQFQSKQYGITKKGINLSDLRELVIALPPIEEQKRIASELRKRLSVTESTEQQITRNLNITSRLRESILKQAFEGKLL